MPGTLDSTWISRRRVGVRPSIAPLAIAGLFLGTLATPNANGQQGRRSARTADTTRTAPAPSGRPSHDSARTGDDSIRISEIAARPPVVTHHTMQLKGAPLAYTATTGMLPIRNDTTGVAEG